MSGKHEDQKEDKNKCSPIATSRAREKPLFHLSHTPPGASVSYALSKYLQIPYTINRYLRDYQREGAQFLFDNYMKSRGCVLGDDMGLGKTVQVISFLAAVLRKTGTYEDAEKNVPHFLLSQKSAEKNKVKKVYLIIAPLSLLYNWKDELDTWGYFKVAILHGAEKRDELARVKKGRVEIALTTYETFRLSLDDFNSVNWAAVIVDEAHKIKNWKSQITKAMKKMRCKVRVGLTGTILQNNLEELYCVMDWAIPWCLGGFRQFKKNFAEPIEHGQKHSVTKRTLAVGRQAVQQLAQRLSGKFLRRTKALIRDQMPAKDDRVVYCSLTEFQQAVYISVLECDDVQLLMTSGQRCPCGSGEPRKKCCFTTNAKGIRVRDLYFSYLAILRKVANHVALLQSTEGTSKKQEQYIRGVCEKVFQKFPEFVARFKGAFFEAMSDPMYSGKMRVLQKLLRHFFEKKDKVLLFSLSTKLLDVLESYCMAEGLEYLRLDGTTKAKERMAIVKEFNGSKNVNLCLVSTMAGGLGLNFVGANVVILFDPTWNPANDLQAIDRVYRIGQCRDVTVFRLISLGTVEEVIYLRQVYKQQLQSSVVGRENSRRYFEAVQGKASVGQAGELFGLRNLFRLQLDGTCLTQRILEREGQIEAGVMTAKTQAAEDKPTAGQKSGGADGPGAEEPPTAEQPSSSSSKDAPGGVLDFSSEEEEDGGEEKGGQAAAAGPSSSRASTSADPDGAQTGSKFSPSKGCRMGNFTELFMQNLGRTDVRGTSSISSTNSGDGGSKDEEERRGDAAGPSRSTAGRGGAGGRQVVKDDPEELSELSDDAVAELEEIEQSLSSSATSTPTKSPLAAHKRPQETAKRRSLAGSSRTTTGGRQVVKDDPEELSDLSDDAVAELEEIEQSLSSSATSTPTKSPLAMHKRPQKTIKRCTAAGPSRSTPGGGQVAKVDPEELSQLSEGAVAELEEIEQSLSSSATSTPTKSPLAVHKRPQETTKRCTAAGKEKQVDVIMETDEEDLPGRFSSEESEDLLAAPRSTTSLKPHQTKKDLSSTTSEREVVTKKMQKVLTDEVMDSLSSDEDDCVVTREGLVTTLKRKSSGGQESVCFVTTKDKDGPQQTSTSSRPRQGGGAPPLGTIDALLGGLNEVSYTHSNQRVVGSSRAENFISKAAARDVFERQGFSQLPAHMLLESQETLPAPPPAPSSSAASRSDRVVKEQKPPLPPQVTGEDPEASRMSHPVTHTLKARHYVRNSTVIIGDTPNMIRKSHFKLMAEFFGAASAQAFADEILKCSSEQRQRMLRQYYSQQNPDLTEVLTQLFPEPASTKPVSGMPAAATAAGPSSSTTTLAASRPATAARRSFSSTTSAALKPVTITGRSATSTTTSTSTVFKPSVVGCHSTSSSSTSSSSSSSTSAVTKPSAVAFRSSTPSSSTASSPLIVNHPPPLSSTTSPSSSSLSSSSKLIAKKALKFAQTEHAPKRHVSFASDGMEESSAGKKRKTLSPPSTSTRKSGQTDALSSAAVSEEERKINVPRRSPIQSSHHVEPNDDPPPCTETRRSDAAAAFTEGNQREDLQVPSKRPWTDARQRKSPSPSPPHSSSNSLLTDLLGDTSILDHLFKPKRKNVDSTNTERLGLLPPSTSSCSSSSPGVSHQVERKAKGKSKDLWDILSEGNEESINKLTDLTQIEKMCSVSTSPVKRDSQGGTDSPLWRKNEKFLWKKQD
ncbi:DNA excision repair protein ERCC-6-like 2 [Engraulis encrasicolus]|uniref:DNA excision repair protein ERCC-6-like 2 n=1 Tax=Engraulis encrasicolus TaxID=184585 RepID=UPI002FD11443